MRYSHLTFIAGCFFLLMLFRSVGDEARQRGERTEMRCAVDATQTLGAPKW